MATTTPNYGLHQWTIQDGLRREELNQDFQTIDTALAALANTAGGATDSLDEILQSIDHLEGRIRITVGQYSGTGSSQLKVELFYNPIAVLVESADGKRTGSSSGNSGGMATRIFDCGSGDNQSIALTQWGFYVYQKSGYSDTNQSGQVYRYLAFS